MGSKTYGFTDLIFQKNVFYSSHFFSFFYFFERRSTSTGMQVGKGQRGGETIPSSLCTVSMEPDAGLKLMNRESMTWADVACLTNRATQVPLLIYLFNVYLFWERERERKSEHMSRGRAERERRERIPSRLHAVSVEPDVGLDFMNCEIMTWAEIKIWTLNWLSHPGALLW